MIAPHKALSQAPMAGRAVVLPQEWVSVRMLFLGGSGRSVMLQPISVEGSVGVEVTLGVAALTLQWVP